MIQLWLSSRPKLRVSGSTYRVHMTPFRLSSRVSVGSSTDPPRRYSRPDSRVRESRPVSGVEPAAYPVPWRVARRSERGVIEFEQLSDEPLRAVRVSLAGGGMLGLSLPRTVHPGERLRVVLRGTGAGGAINSPDAMLLLRWFQSDGTELLWPIAL